MDTTQHFILGVSCAALLVREHLEVGPTTKLYVVRDGDLVKFGISANPKSRFQNLKVANPRTLSLVLAVPATENVERFIHRVFAPEREAGEWFRVTERVETVLAWLTEIERILAGPGYDDQEVDSGDTIAWLVSPAEDMLMAFTESVLTPLETKP